MFHPNLPNIPTSRLVLYQRPPLGVFPDHDIHTVVHGEDCGGEIRLPFCPGRKGGKREIYRGFCAKCKRRVSQPLQRVLSGHLNDLVDSTPFDIIPSLRHSMLAEKSWVSVRTTYFKHDEVVEGV